MVSGSTISGGAIPGTRGGEGQRIALVVSRFNESVTSKLLAGATAALRGHGVAEADLTVVWVPGAWEIPPVAARLARCGCNAVVCLGAVIRGDTPHFDYVSGRVAAGVAAAGDAAAVPVIFGVLTCDTVEQAVDRAGGKAGNKGADAALAALEMIEVYARLAAALGREPRDA